MESFLFASKNALANLERFKRIRIVLGNSTCDLDSAVSALVQGFFEHQNAIKTNETDVVVIPLMNIPEKEYRVKTEVVYFLNRHNIPPNLLTFRDQIDLITLRENGLTRLEIILVDHHSLPEEDAFLTECVIKVIDHRPRDLNWPWHNRNVQIEIVGSCATLVARNILATHPELVDSLLSSLLRGPILLDTCNLSKEAGRTTFTDIQTIEALEQIGSSIPQRNVVFDELLAAKTDTSKLSVDDLLIRDLKVAAGVPLVGLPMLVRKFVEFEGVFATLNNFASSKSNAIVILLGMLVQVHQVARDVAIYFLTGHTEAEKIIEALTQSTQPNLRLTLRLSIEDPVNEKWRLVLYDQGNVRATRKQILPIVRDTITSLCSC